MSPTYQQITLLLFLLSFSPLPVIPISLLFTYFHGCSLQFCIGFNIPFVARFEPATNLYAPHDSHLHRTIARVTFLRLFPLFLVLKKSKQQREETDLKFLFTVAAFIVLNILIQLKPLRDCLRTRENNFSGTMIGPDPNSLALKKRLLVNSMDFE